MEEKKSTTIDLTLRRGSKSGIPNYNNVLIPESVWEESIELLNKKISEEDYPIVLIDVNNGFVEDNYFGLLTDINDETDEYNVRTTTNDANFIGKVMNAIIHDNITIGMNYEAFVEDNKDGTVVIHGITNIKSFSLNFKGEN